MKHIFAVLVLFAASTISLFAQVQPSTASEYNWPATTAAATGVVGQYLILDGAIQGVAVGPTASFTIQAVIAGTVPSACTFEVQSSPDGTNWDTGTNSLSGDIACNAASGVALTYSFFSKPVRYIRINIGTLTGADGTTRAKFFYTGKVNGK